MIAVLALLAVQALPGPPEAEMNGAIFHDVQANAMIGNGNQLVSWDWAFGVDEAHPPSLTISERQCRNAEKSRRRCSFKLSRMVESSVGVADGLPKTLAYTADFIVETESDGTRRWTVIHKPARRGVGHSRTTMKCRVAPPPKVARRVPPAPSSSP